MKQNLGWGGTERNPNPKENNRANPPDHKDVVKRLQSQTRKRNSPRRKKAGGWTSPRKEYNIKRRKADGDAGGQELTPRDRGKQGKAARKNARTTGEEGKIPARKKNKK